MRLSSENLLFLITGAASYALIQLICNRRQRENNKKQALLKEDRKSSSLKLQVKNEQEYDADEKARPKRPVLTHTIEKELFSRNVAFFGDDGQHNIRTAYVIVVGLGGVGSHCAHMLARSGVGRMKVIDFDQVTLSSLNRHATASFSDVGQPKVEVLKNCLAGMAPACHVIAVNELFHAKEAFELLLPQGQRRPDFVIDAIDDVNTKVELLLFCKEQGLRVISALSAGSKVDPTRMHIGTMADAVKDPLASKIRWKLKKAEVDPETIPVLYSSELQRVELLPLSKEQKENPEEFGVLDNFRVRVIPVVGTMPATFGQALAAYVLCELAKKPFTPQPGPRLTAKLMHKMHQQLRNREIKIYGNTEPNIDQAAVEHLVCQIWRQRCAVTGSRLGGHSKLPVLTRWDPKGGLVPNNLVLLMPNEAEKLIKDGKSAFELDISKRITQKLACMGDDWG